MSKSNICVYGLAKQFTDDIGKELASRLDVFYANFEKIFEFEMIDLNRMEQVCGKEYFLKKESSILKRLCTYVNTLINIDYSLLNNDINKKILQDNSLLIYLKLSSERFKKEIQKDKLSNGNFAMNLDLFNDRDQICESNADIIVNCDDLNESGIIDSIIVELLKYFDQQVK